MPHQFKGIFFDVDGVLLDSLPDHLAICRAKAAKFGLKIDIPSVQQFQKMIHDGVKVSPMFYFFLAVGFPETEAELATHDYEAEFSTHYHPKPFPDVLVTLRALKTAGLELGLITSNTRVNVESALTDCLLYFNQNCLFYFDSYAEPKTKSWCLRQGASALGLNTEDCVYIGDQPNDAKEAQQANTSFIGVTYGWGIPKSDTRYSVVHSLAELRDKLIQQNKYKHAI